MSRIKLAEIRFYVDAGLLGLAHVLARLRHDVTFPGDTGAVIHKRSRLPCPRSSTRLPERLCTRSRSLEV